MKRMLSVILCVLLLGALAVPAFAEGSAHMSLSANPGTLYRGDSFAVSVYLSNDQVVARGGIVLSYDASVFEFLGGSCNVSGATLAEVSAGRNGGVFALAEGRVVSGTIFTIQMRVRSDAPFGTYSISGTASMDIPCGVSGTSVTVACAHRYGEYSSLDGSIHRRTCEICHQSETTAHRWDSGRVTKAATCVASGTRVHTCSDCGQTKTETIQPTGNHSYGNWAVVDDNGHRGKCTVCGNTGVFAHTWQSVEVLQAPTCQTTGQELLRCGTCGHEKQQELPLTDHQYGTPEPVDENTHRAACVHCGREETWDHSYADQYGHDGHGHFRVCEGCGAQEAHQDHVPGPAATGSEPQLCTVCGRMLQAALNHVHSYLTQWTMDDQGHWYSCEFCGNREGQQLHSFDNGCDTTCDICGYSREPVHDYSDLLTADETGHYHLCRVCGVKTDAQTHVPGSAATIHSSQSCTACGYELAPKLPHTHEFTAESGTHVHVCSCGATSPGVEGDNCDLCPPEEPEQTFPWEVLCGVEAVLLAVAVILLLRKKKQG